MTDKEKLELLRNARLLMNKEYISKRAEQHKQWIVTSEASWRTAGVLLPYPTGELYPSEEEVVAKALELYNLSNNIKPITNVPLPIQTDQPSSVTAQLEEVYNTTVPRVISEVAPVTASPWVDYLAPELKSTIQPVELALEIETPSVNPEDNSVSIPEIETDVIEDEPVNEPLESEPAKPDSTEKHSLLRNVLASWLQKNKDKET